jgi:branched-chain amino acid transport system ATP-binding protein
LVKAIAGLVPVHSGKAALGHIEITDLPAHEKIRHGLGFVPQTENIFATLSIDDNLLLAADILPKEKRGERIAALYAMFPDLAERPSRRAGALSGGQRQMLAVARALIVEPKVLILDEPSAGLSPKIVSEVFLRLKEINGRGVTIVLVEQNVKAALTIADRAVILVEGRVAHEGTAAGLSGDPLIGELYLGARRDSKVVP